MAASRTIVIAGAGIGGLTAALALARHGFRIVLLEKAERLEETGAGLQISPNASRILIDLGLGPRLAPRAVAPDGISIMSARRGGEIARLPLGEAYAARAGAPYWVIHRADLQAALVTEVNGHPDIDLRLGCAFEEAVSEADGLSVAHRAGDVRAREAAAALIGADGAWSSVRRQLFPEIQPRFSGLIAWRGTVDAARLPPDDSECRVQLWMGPNAHLVAYPISGGRRLNVVAVVPGAAKQPGASAPADAIDIGGRFTASQWPAAARRIVGAVESWRRWPLYTVPGSRVWTQGAATLLGDAAHAMLPFAAQGAAMAIEDAAVLAACLGGAEASAIPAALIRYAELRRARVARVRRTARQSGEIYHLRGPMAVARDVAIRAMGPRRLLARQDWIYDWRI